MFDELWMMRIKWIFGEKMETNRLMLISFWYTEDILQKLSNDEIGNE